MSTDTFQIPNFCVKEYKKHLEQCLDVTNAICNSGSVVGDNFMIWNNTIEVSSSISDEAIQTVCEKLFSYDTTANVSIKVTGDKKIFTLEKQ